MPEPIRNAKPKGPRRAASPSWRQIRQTVRREASSEAGIRRRFQVRAGAITLSLALIGGLALVGYGAVCIVREPERLVRIGDAEPLRSVAFRTDGVLSRDWLRENLKLDPETSVLELDIFSIRRQLEVHGQIARAVVERELPNRLRISLNERTPAFRIVVPGEAGRRRILLVATDGVVFEGRDYESARLRNLPFLTGMRLRRDASGFLPVEGMAKIVRVMEAARERHPAVVADWRVIDMEDFDPDPEAYFSTIRVRGERIGQTLLSLEDPEGQINRLSDIMDFLLDRGVARVARVDLRFGAAVPVEVVAAADSPARRVAN